MNLSNVSKLSKNIIKKYLTSTLTNENKSWLNKLLLRNPYINFDSLKFIIENPIMRKELYYNLNLDTLTLIKKYITLTNENKSWLNKLLLKNLYINVDSLNFFIENPIMRKELYYNLNLDILTLIKKYITLKLTNENKSWLDRLLLINLYKYIDFDRLNFFIKNPIMRKELYYNIILDIDTLTLINDYLSHNNENKNWLDVLLTINPIINHEHLNFFIDNRLMRKKLYYNLILDIDTLTLINDYLSCNNENKSWLDVLLTINPIINYDQLKFFIDNRLMRKKLYYELQLPIEILTLQSFKDSLNEGWIQNILTKIPDMTFQQFEYFLYNSSKRNEDNQIINIDITDFSLNIGIEIEVCTAIIQNNLQYFKNVNNESISCNNNKDSCEYVIEGFIRNNNLIIIKNNIQQIINTSNKNNNENVTNKLKCKDNSCGLHFHISSENILLNLHGLIFLINFIEEWNNKYQENFRDLFFYQLNLVGETYAKPLVLTEEQFRLLDFYKIELLEKIKNKELFVSNKYLYSIYDGIIDKISKNRPYLTVVPDTKYIHVEFRGLLPWNLHKQIDEFPLFVKEKYLEVIEYTNNEINSYIQ
jgi:hypothetical protein